MMPPHMTTWGEIMALRLVSVLALGIMALACGSESDGGLDADTASPADASDTAGLEDASADAVWTASGSGLTWQLTVDIAVPRDNAFDACKNSTVAGGGWRLPTIDELRTLVEGCGSTATGGPCGVTDDCTSPTTCGGSDCDGCGMSAECLWPDALGQGYCGTYWSANTDGASDYFWTVNFVNGAVSFDHRNGYAYYRCVR